MTDQSRILDLAPDRLGLDGLGGSSVPQKEVKSNRAWGEECEALRTENSRLKSKIDYYADLLQRKGILCQQIATKEQSS